VADYFPVTALGLPDLGRQFLPLVGFFGTSARGPSGEEANPADAAAPGRSVRLGVQAFPARSTQLPSPISEEACPLHRVPPVQRRGRPAQPRSRRNGQRARESPLFGLLCDQA